MFHHAVLLAFLCYGVSASPTNASASVMPETLPAFADVLTSAASAPSADAFASAEPDAMLASAAVLTSASSAPSADAFILAEPELVAAEPEFKAASADVLTSAPSASSADAFVFAEPELVAAEPEFKAASADVLTSASSAPSAAAFVSAEPELVAAEPEFNAASADVLTSAPSASSADAFSSAEPDAMLASAAVLTSASSAPSADAFVLADPEAMPAFADVLSSADGRLTGRITDTSAAALPGVTVTITADTLTPPVVLITDEVGRYTSPPLPEGRYTITFELGGFTPQRREAVDVRAGEVVVLDRQLVVGTVTENVEVVAAAPPPPAPFPKFEATPAPKITPIPREALASVCGPGQPGAEDMSIGKILGHRDETSRTVFGARDILLLDIGADFGAAVGQNYVVRRRFRLGDKTLPINDAAFGEQTAALVQVVEAHPATSVAVVVYACGELFAGDSIEPFDPLPLLSAQAAGAPQFDDPARIILGEHGFSMGAPQQLMVIDRGTAHGAVRGQRLTIFRRMQGENGPVSRIADAVVIAVREHSATIRIERASDAVSVGDLAALHH